MEMSNNTESNNGQTTPLAVPAMLGIVRALEKPILSEWEKCKENPTRLPQIPRGKLKGDHALLEEALETSKEGTVLHDKIEEIKKKALDLLKWAPDENVAQTMGDEE